MQYLLSLLPVLACPLGMGALMWLMMRGVREPSPANTSKIASEKEGERAQASVEQPALPESPAPSQPSPFKTIWDCVQMCLNWKVLVGLILAAALIGVLAPSLFTAAFPILVILVCPLSMGIMMLRMGRMRHNTSSGSMGEMACCAGQAGVETPAEPKEAFEQPIGERNPVTPRW